MGNAEFALLRGDVHQQMTLNHRVPGSSPGALRKPHVSDTTPNRAFRRGFPATHFLDFGLCRRSRILVAILALCLCIQKFRSRQPGFEHEVGPHRTRNSRLLGRRNSGPSAGAAAYSGLSPSASNCRLHSVGGSRSRSTPMPRGRRPSTAALTRLGARKAIEIVILTCRTLHFSRVQSSAIVVIRLETTSSSHRRPRAIALTGRRPALELFRTDVASRCIVRKQDLAGSFGGWFLPGN